MADIPTTEPSVVTAGDTVKWTRALAEYSAADGWTLKYKLANLEGSFDVNASASGADHAVIVTAADSAKWGAGAYQWQAWVEKAAERYTIGTGSIEVKPNLAAQKLGYETRTRARRILEKLEAEYESRVDGGQGFVWEYEIAGRRMKFHSAADFMKAIEYWRHQAAQESAAESVAKGLGNPRRLHVRFAGAR